MRRESRVDGKYDTSHRESTTAGGLAATSASCHFLPTKRSPIVDLRALVPLYPVKSSPRHHFSCILWAFEIARLSLVVCPFGLHESFIDNQYLPFRLIEAKIRLQGLQSLQLNIRVRRPVS